MVKQTDLIVMIRAGALPLSLRGIESPDQALTRRRDTKLPELIIFDCDGVLVDSEIIAARIEAEIISEAGFPITPEDLAARYAGLTFPDILKRIEMESAIPLQASLIERAVKRTDRKLEREVRALEGARSAVSRIELPRCVCSNSTAARVRTMLGKTGLLELFEPHIFVAEETASKKAKPAPDVFLHAAGIMDVDPVQALVIEDSVHGVSAARAAGMRVVGFTGGSHSFPGHADHLTEAGAETVINKLRDLEAVIEAFSVWSEPI